MRIRVGASTDIGRARQRNEDAYLLREPLFAVADGMGGHRAGDVASSLAVESLGAAEPPAERAEGEDPLAELVRRIEAANRRVLERGEAERDLEGMGTTITALISDHDRAHVAHVGDSRAYLLRDGSLTQLTEDHTLVQRMVREGRLSADDAETHPQRSILTRALGVDEEISVDQLTLDLHTGDRVLLCTDGLSSMVDRKVIQDILEGEEDPQRASERLVEAANGAGGEDNITVVVLDFLEETTRGEGAPTVVEDPRGGPTPGPEPEEEGGSAPPTETAPGVAERPVVPEPKLEERRGIRWGRVAAWIVGVVVVLAVALVAFRLYVDRQWYVGDADGRVAIYNGLPIEVAGVDVSRVEEQTDIPTARATELQLWRNLEGGITAGSLQEARAIVEQIRRDVGAGEGRAPP